MSVKGHDVVIGAFGFSGKYIAERLLASGRCVVTLTGRPDRENPFGDSVPALPFSFDNPDKLAESLRGADTLYNTYWIRFERGPLTFERTVANSKALIDAAVRAGVRRIVHVSITNPSLDSHLPYFRGKAQVEEAIVSSGLSYAILRPAVIFGLGGILINNIAWFLRKLPVFGVAGSGEYRVRPIFVSDLAELAVRQGRGEENVVLDAVGPEEFAYIDMVRMIRNRIEAVCVVLRVPPAIGLLSSRVLGALLRDVVLTRDEVDGLLGNLLSSDAPATGTTGLSDWVEDNADWLGRRYFSELAAHYR